VPDKPGAATYGGFAFQRNGERIDGELFDAPTQPAQGRPHLHTAPISARGATIPQLSHPGRKASGSHRPDNALRARLMRNRAPPIA